MPPETGSPTFETIVRDLVPEWMKQFQGKDAEYGDTASDLGAVGQYCDMHRKMRKLRRAFVDGVDTSEWSEQPREILMDLIGHCFLTIRYIDAEERAK